VNSIGTGLPEKRYSKGECWGAFAQSEWFDRLSPRAHAVAKSVLRRDNGIEVTYWQSTDHWELRKWRLLRAKSRTDYRQLSYRLRKLAKGLVHRYV